MAAAVPVPCVLLFLGPLAVLSHGGDPPPGGDPPRGGQATELPAEVIERIHRNLKSKYRNRFGKEYRREYALRYLPYLHRTVEEPVGAGLVLDVPDELGNRELARLGLVDVTAGPFRADPTGGRDATAALQEAIDFARDRQMVCFFPAGTYRVSDTITCMQNYYLRANGAVSPASRYPCVLVGSTRDPHLRAKILLAPDSPGFGDPARRRFVVHFLNRSAPPGDPSRPQANISFNQVFANIDIEIGPGNAGAVGIRMQAAEGSSIQDCTIDATHGFIGMQGAAGSGGSHHNITVIGGRIGIDTHGFPPEFSLKGTGTQPTPTMAHVTLVGQTEAALVNKSRGPLVGVGWKIVARTGGPAIVVEKDGRWAPFNSSLCLVDSVIVFESASEANTAISSERSFYLNNVYLKNAGVISEGFEGHPGGWIHVRELARSVHPGRVKQYRVEEPVYLDGKRSGDSLFDFTVGDPPAGGEAPPKDLRARHIWDRDFPSWESPGAANVKEPPYGAKGDGRADDTAALQKAVDENEIVFLPKGYYRLTRTLVLRPNTKLVGAAQHLSVLMARDQEGVFADPDHPAPLVDTADDPAAETVLAFLGIMPTWHVESARTRGDVLGCYALRWRCGRRSVFRTVEVRPGRLYGFRPLPEGVRALTIRHPLVRITGHGGGRWYNFFIHGHCPFTPDYRHILIHDKGAEPLGFYHLHAQHADSEAQCEMRSSRNVSVFGVKTEYHTRFLIVRDSRNVRIFGHGGNARATVGSAHYLFENTTDFLISNIGDQARFEKTEPVTQKGWVLANKRNIREYYPLIDTPPGGERIEVPSLERPVLYRRGRYTCR